MTQKYNSPRQTGDEMNDGQVENSTKKLLFL